MMSGAWWLINRFDAFHPKGRGFESHSSRHIGGDLGQVLLSHFSVKPRHSIYALSGALLSSRGLEEALWK